MKFSEFINEDVDFEKLAEILLKKCMPVLKDLQKDKNNLGQLPLIGKKVVLRQAIKIRKARNKRKPTDPPTKIHNFIDNYFDNKYRLVNMLV